jgi:hypothetical protein
MIIETYLTKANTSTVPVAALGEGEEPGVTGNNAREG